MGDIVSDVITGIAVLAAIASAVFAGQQNKHAKDANKHASDANDNANDALDESREANRLSQLANDLSHEANDLVKAQEARQTDSSVIVWDVSWDPRSHQLLVENIGRDSAADVTVVVRSEKLGTVTHWEPSAATGVPIAVPVEEFTERRKAQPGGARVDRGGVVATTPFSAKADVRITWAAPSGRIDVEEWKAITLK